VVIEELCEVVTLLIAVIYVVKFSWW